MMSIFGNHKVAFEFSGGKDSLAALYMVEGYWPLMTVYWLDTGDAVPEVREFVQTIALKVPHFRVVNGKQPETIAKLGWPVDTLPADASLFGRLTTKPGPVFQSRESCCVASLMLPLHEQMKADGITLVLRGQKRSDMRKAPISSGHVEDGIEYWFPIENWSDQDVLDYLATRKIALPPYYALLRASPDCLTCTAYLDENRKQFLQERHPEAWQTVRLRLSYLRDALAEPLARLNEHLED